MLLLLVEPFDLHLGHSLLVISLAAKWVLTASLLKMRKAVNAAQKDNS